MSSNTRATKKTKSSKKTASSTVRKSSGSAKTKKTTKAASTKKRTVATKKAASKKSQKKKVSATTSKKTNNARTSRTARKVRPDESPAVTLPEHAFWVNDGMVLHSLHELADALKNMDRVVYEHHVNQYKHDFADWVEHALSQQHCAHALRTARTPRSARTVIVTHLKQLPL